MAEYHHTPAPGPAKAKYPIYRKLTVLETTRESAPKTRGIGINYVPVSLEPCLVLRGKWLRRAGFTAGKKVVVVIHEDELTIKPKQEAES
ncbi:SymE family type I addiction module toxin [Thalassomonas haliotis]|uniref:Type I addiction module toxin, SymE family n=1 Tax=Thalassomonas haliotis TaxID=485448 RepID=A0ABY7VCH9_9GAMM|nr:SymE family type I addiction module toxin [Thalassomonas haliotis]WDE11031.1 type I addiction module toxin, SymE family [Thalassomonas haliotis]